MSLFDMFNKKYESMNVNDVYDVKGAKVIDVRSRPEYQGFHIAGSKNIPLEDILVNKMNLDKSKKYYLVCQSGMRSAMACNHLVKEGYDVVNLKGGMSAYRR